MLCMTFHFYFQPIAQPVQQCQIRDVELIAVDEITSTMSVEFSALPIAPDDLSSELTSFTIPLDNLCDMIQDFSKDEDEMISEIIHILPLKCKVELNDEENTAVIITF